MTKSIYRIDPERDLHFAQEFFRNPVGHHSAGLQRVLNLFRGEPLEGKYVLVCVKPHKEWQLAVLSGKRGEPVRLVDGKIYHDLEEAERDVFKLRWKAFTGHELQ
jgi:hypothetical protein